MTECFDGLKMIPSVECKYLEYLDKRKAEKSKTGEPAGQMGLFYNIFLPIFPGPVGGIPALKPKEGMN